MLKTLDWTQTIFCLGFTRHSEGDKKASTDEQSSEKTGKEEEKPPVPVPVAVAAEQELKAEYKIGIDVIKGEVREC